MKTLNEVVRELTQLRRELDDMQKHIARMPTRRGGGSGGGFDIPTVEVLPDLPVTAPTLVHLVSRGMNLGELVPKPQLFDQLWYADQGSEEWSPMNKLTHVLGVAGGDSLVA